MVLAPARIYDFHFTRIFSPGVFPLPFFARRKSLLENALTFPSFTNYVCYMCAYNMDHTDLPDLTIRMR